MTEELITPETAKLAREKGFDWVVRHCWEHNTMDKKMPWRPQDPPPDHELISNWRNMFMKYQHDQGALSRLLKMAEVKPLHNSRLPQFVYARPSQALLKRWLRDVHGIVAYGILIRGSRARSIPPLYLPHVYDLWDDGKQWHGKGACATMELADEEACRHGLKSIA